MSKTMFLRKSSDALLALLLLASCNTRHAAHAPTVPFYNSADFTPVWIENASDVDEKISHRIDDFVCTDQGGRRITNTDVRGKIHVADFFFTGCAGICPAMTSNMKTVQDAFAGDSNVVLLSFSVAPRSDSVARLREYAAAHGVAARTWHLLTGDKQQIYTLARTSYFAEETMGYSRDSSQFLHTEHFVLVDRRGCIRGIYNGTLPLEAARLIGDIRAIE